MSEEKTPEEHLRQDVADAITRWQDGTSTEEDGPLADADALLDALAHFGLQVLPIAPDVTPFVVLKDGEPVAQPGTDFTGPHHINDAVHMVLDLAEDAWVHGLSTQIVMRTATAEELDAADAREREILHRDLGSPPF